MKTTIVLFITSLVCCFATSHNRQKRQTSCTLTGSSISTLNTIKSLCSNIIIQNLTVPAGRTLDLRGLQTGATVTFRGTTRFGYREWDGPLIRVSGTSINVRGDTGNLIDGEGALYWDRLGGNDGITKPRLFRANRMVNSVIQDLNIYNSPRHVFSINNNRNLTISNILIDIRSGDNNGAHNTDGFDVSQSTDIIISNCQVYNQDDCLAVNSVDGLRFLNNFCSGGHGISIGSVGGRNNNNVSNVEIANNVVVDSDNGLRIKTVVNTTGLVVGAIFRNNTLTNIRNAGISIRGDYRNIGSTGTPSDGVPIRNLVMNDIRGTVASNAYRYYILVAAASNWSFSNINLSGGRSSNVCVGLLPNSGLSC